MKLAFCAYARTRLRLVAEAVPDVHPHPPAWLEKQGVRFTPGGIRKGAAGYDVCFVHPKGNAEFPIGAEGVLVELVAAPPEVIEAFRTLASSGGQS